MTDQPTGYEDEPKEIFAPLPAKLAAQFYDIELFDYTEDIGFFDHNLPLSGNILELGCGTGRLIRHLSHSTRLITGIDISPAMLAQAKQALKGRSHRGLVCMDMRTLSFLTKFDAIYIGYNTLNLLSDLEQISNCLRACREILNSGSQLLLQLHIPAKALTEKSRNTFHFQTFDLPTGGKLIKEIRKSPNPTRQILAISERYRVRKEEAGKILKEDYEQRFTVAAWPFPRWNSIFEECGFRVVLPQQGHNHCPHPEPSQSRMLRLSAK